MNTEKIIGLLLLIGGLTFSTIRIIGWIGNANEYSNIAGSYWGLSEKASTIEQKSEYMDKYVQGIESLNLEGSNSALFYPTPNSSFDENYKAVKSLQGRLHEIKTMDASSFEYQTAMQQITAQEQGEGDNMTDEIKSCWNKEHHYTYWNPIVIALFVFLQGILIILGGIFFNRSLN